MNAALSQWCASSWAGSSERTGTHLFCTVGASARRRQRLRVSHAPRNFLVPRSTGRYPSRGGSLGASRRPLVRGARGIPLLYGQGPTSQRGGGVLAFGGPDSSATPLDVGPSGGVAPGRLRAIVLPCAQDSGGGADGARGSSLPSLRTVGGPRPLFAAATTNDTQVPATA